MIDTAISATNLSKRYDLVTRGNRKGDLTLKDHLTQGAKSVAQKMLRRSDKADQSDFWALQEVSFEVGRGEIVGFIGRNGAGKSTLLKVLSRITEPTRGRVEIEGRVASLLEVGTGFHAELTGRENIYLNGAILGMSRLEINRKFDEIVAFAEVEKFLDTPVKRYSSGMYVRLAFAVAAHLEPDILIVDEVLAVGDAAFQKKCLGKMGDVSAQEGRTVLFVSHNMETVQALCDRAYLLESGRIVGQGDTEGVIGQYLRSMQSLMLDGASETQAIGYRPDRGGDGSVKMVSLTLESADGEAVIRADSRLKITIGYQSAAPIQHPQFCITIYDFNRNVGMLRLHSNMMGGLPDELPAEGTVTCTTEPLYLTPGRCYVNLSLFRAGGQIRADRLQYAAYFDIERTDIFGGGQLPSRKWSACLRQHEWSVQGGSPAPLAEAAHAKKIVSV